MIKINGVDIAVSPSVFKPTILDFDDADSSVRTADGTLNRDRIAVKRQIELEFGPIAQDKMAALLQSMKDVFFDVTYPDPMDGTVTKRMYVGNRPATFAVMDRGVLYWSGLKIILTER